MSSAVGFHLYFDLTCLYLFIWCKLQELQEKWIEKRWTELIHCEIVAQEVEINHFKKLSVYEEAEIFQIFCHINWNWCATNVLTFEFLRAFTKLATSMRNILLKCTVNLKHFDIFAIELLQIAGNLVVLGILMSLDKIVNQCSFLFTSDFIDSRLDLIQFRALRNWLWWVI